MSKKRRGADQRFVTRWLAPEVGVKSDKTSEFMTHYGFEPVVVKGKVVGWSRQNWYFTHEVAISMAARGAIDYNKATEPSTEAL